MILINDDYSEYEEEPREVQTVTIHPPQPCHICGRPERDYACFRCGKPVCYNKQDYFADTACGGWILDTWHPSHPEDNEFYCRVCLSAGQIEDQMPVEFAQGQLAAVYSEEKTLIIVSNETTWKLDQEETRKLVAYLIDQQGDLFAKQYDPDSPEESAQKTEELELPPDPFATVGSDRDDILGDLDQETF